MKEHGEKELSMKPENCTGWAVTCRHVRRQNLCSEWKEKSLEYHKQKVPSVTLSFFLSFRSYMPTTVTAIIETWTEETSRQDFSRFAKYFHSYQNFIQPFLERELDYAFKISHSKSKSIIMQVIAFPVYSLEWRDNFMIMVCLPQNVEQKRWSKILFWIAL